MAYQDPNLALLLSQLSTPRAQAASSQEQVAQPEAKKSFQLTDVLPIAGGVLGGLIGTPIGGPVGAVGGGALGSAAGETLRQYITGQHDTGKIVKEGAMGLAGGAAGEALGAGARLLGLGIKGASKASGSALTRALEQKAASKVEQFAGQKLAQTGEGLALRGLRPTPSQQAKFAATTGDTLQNFIAKNGLIGKNPDEFIAATDALQNQFDNLIVNSAKKIKIKPSEVRSEVLSSALPYLRSTNSAQRQVGERIVSEAQSILNQYPKGLTPQELTAVRRDFDKSVRSWTDQAGGVTSEAAREIRDSLQGLLRKKTTDSGIFTDTGQSLDQIGKNLQKHYAATDIVKRQQFLGKGTQPLSLPNLLGAGAGGAVGGLPGAAAGMAATSILNNPKVIGMGANALIKGGERLALPSTLAARGAAQTIGQFLPRSSAIDTTQAAPGQDASQNDILNQDVTTPISDQVNQQDQSNQVDKAALAQILINDIRKNKGKNVNSIISIIKLLSPTQKPLSSTQANAASYADRIANSEDILNKNIPKSFLEFYAYRKGITPNPLRSEEIQRFDAAARDIVAANLRKESGAAISQSELDDAFNRYIPVPGDKPGVLADKARTRKLILRGLQREANMQQNNLSGITSLLP